MKRKFNLLAGLTLFLGILSTPIQAQESQSETVLIEDTRPSYNYIDRSKEIFDKIQQLYPNLNIVEVSYLPLVNLYELKSKDYKDPLSYTDENINFFILDGQIVDPVNAVNVSQLRDIVKNQGFFNTLPFNESITIQYGNGERKIAIFTDPDCPYCQHTDQLIHKEMGNDNIRISYFMNPLPLPGHENAPEKAKKIWCSDNKELSWVQWMFEKKLPDNNGTCPNPVESNMKLSQESNFMVTPLILFDNGIIWRGAIEPAKIREILNSLEPLKE